MLTGQVVKELPGYSASSFFANVCADDEEVGLTYLEILKVGAYADNCWWLHTLPKATSSPLRMDG